MSRGYDMFDKVERRPNLSSRKCEICGKAFIPKQVHHKTCYHCFSSSGIKIITACLPAELLLTTYYKGDSLLKEIFIDIPKKLSNIFVNSRPPLASKQLRDFYQAIYRARNTALLKGIEVARPLLYACQRDVEYQLKRDVIPESFCQFMKHHLKIAEKDEKTLSGFCEHLQSIIAYFPK